MKCPDCNGKLRVIDCTGTDTEMYRKRECESCGKTLYSIEVIDSRARYAISLIKYKKYRIPKKKSKENHGD
jgi:transcriptional regulator NrdR family protein